MTRGVALLVLAAALAGPAAAREAPPGPGTTRDFSLPGRDTIELENGLSITFIDYGRVPKVTLLAAVRTGSIDEGDDTWLADLTAEMLKEGTASLDAGELARRAAGMGGSLFVAAGAEQTSVGMAVLSEHAVAAAALVADVLRRPRLPESELPRIVASLARGLAIARADAASLADEAIAELAWGGHPFGRTLPSDGQLAAYTPADVRRFHAANFGARRTHVYVAGRFDRAPLESALVAAFADWAPGPAATERPPALRAGPAVRFIDRPDAPQSTLRLALAAPDPTDPQWMSFSLMNTLLGGSFDSRLMNNLREDKGYAYSPGSSIVARRRAALWELEADVTTADSAAALAEMFAEVRRIAADEPLAEELAAARNFRAGLFVVQNSSPNGVLGQLAFLDLHGLPPEYLTGWVARLHALTPADVRGAAARWADLSQVKLAVVGDLARVEAAIRALPELAAAEDR